MSLGQNCCGAQGDVLCPLRERCWCWIGQRKLPPDAVTTIALPNEIGEACEWFDELTDDERT